MSRAKSLGKYRVVYRSNHTWNWRPIAMNRNWRFFVPYMLVVLLSVSLLGCSYLNGQRAPRGTSTDSILCMALVDNTSYHPYRVYFPKSYAHAPDKKGEKPKRFPMLLACHPGEGDEVSYFQWKGGPDRIQDIADEREYIVVCPGLVKPDYGLRGESKEDPEREIALDEDPGPEIILAIIEEMKKRRWIDTNRIYCMGASRGGLVTYTVASENPDLFAAVAGVCANILPEQIDELKKTPVLSFMAAKDKFFPIGRARRMQDNLRKAGGEVKYVEVPGGHGGYRDRETYELLFDWFDAHVKGEKQEKKGEFELDN